MHVLVIKIDVDPGRIDEARTGLTEFVVPTVKSSAGFVSGTWAESHGGTKGVGMVLAESEAHAIAMGEAAKQGPADGPVTIRSVDVYEVIAQA